MQSGNTLIGMDAGSNISRTEPQALQPRTLLALLALLLAAAVFVFWDVGRTFNQTDEFLYAGVIQEMVASGDYLTPRFGPIDLFTKPPLFYWIGAAVLHLTGDVALSVRLLPGISFLALIVLVFSMVRRAVDEDAGLLAAFVFAFCYDHLFNHVYRAGVMEGFLILQMALVLWLNVRLLERPGSLRWIAALVGTAFLTKSVFAVIPAAVTGLNVLMNRRQLRLSTGLFVQSAGIFLLVVLPWFIAVIATHGSRVLQYMFVDQVWSRALNDREAAAATGRSFGRDGTLYVLRHYMEYGQPWSLFVWPAIAHALRRRTQSDQGTNVLLSLSMFWFVLVMCLFLVSRGRWSWYIASVYVPASILIGIMLRDFVREQRLWVAPAIWLAACLAMLLPTTVFVFNPYATSSGAFPLRMDLVREFMALCVIAPALYLVWRRDPPADAGGDAGRAAAIALVALVLAYCAALLRMTWLDARAPLSPPLLPHVLLPGFVVAGCGVILAGFLRANVAVRKALVACVAIVALTQLLAPLPWARGDNQRWEITLVQAGLDSGRLDRDGQMTIRGLSLFSFIPIYATFGRAYEVTYDRARMTLQIRHRTDGSEAQTESGSPDTQGSGPRASSN